MAADRLAMRVADPDAGAEDIAAAVAYCTSDEAGYYTGQTLTVDGGMTMC